MKKTPLIKVSLYLPNEIIHKFSNAKNEKIKKKRLFKIIAICFRFPGFPNEPRIIPIMGLIISISSIGLKFEVMIVEEMRCYKRGFNNCSSYCDKKK